MTDDDTAELLESFADWLDDRYPDDGVGDDLDAMVSSAELLLDWWTNYREAPLSALAESDVREFLLKWSPRQLTMSAEAAELLCGDLADFIVFLGSTRVLRGSDHQVGVLAQQTLALAAAAAEAMTDPANWGMAKTLVAGLDVESMTQDELRAALDQRMTEYNSLPFDDRRALTDRFFDEPELRELPFLYVPPTEAAVAADVADADLPEKLAALRDYLGDGGKVLTAKGNLKLADGRALVELLDTGDEIDQRIGDRTFRTQSTEELRHLGFLVEVAKRAGAVCLQRNRLVPVKAWARRSAVDAATALFGAVLDAGVLSWKENTYFQQLHECVDSGVVYWLANLLEPGCTIDFDAVVELNAEVVSSNFEGRSLDYYLSETGLAHDLSRILSVLEMTGALRWTDPEETVDNIGTVFPTGGTISLTEFGRQVVRPCLEPIGITVASVGDLADADATELVAALRSVPPDARPALLASWQPELTTSERAGLVAALTTEAADADTRLIGIHLLGMFGDDAAVEPHMRQLLGTDAAGHAAMWLLERGLADPDAVGGFITPAVLIDILSQLLDEPELLCEQFLRVSDSEQLLEFFWRHAAPETAPVLDTLGRHLSDPKLAKAARKAAMRHRSWLANEQPG